MTAEARDGFIQTGKDVGIASASETSARLDLSQGDFESPAPRLHRQPRQPDRWATPL